MELITYVFPDFKAVEYFQKEFADLGEFHVAEETTSSGFEIYLIDQWVRSRRIGSIISVFTGNPDSVVNVVKFTVTRKPADHYPARFQEYLNELVLNHATLKKMSPHVDSAGLSTVSRDTRQKEYLFVTNLTAFPHNLNVLSVVSGDARSAMARFRVNSNLRVFQCGGRFLSVLAEKVSESWAGRFRQIYRLTDEVVPVEFAILELVNLIQTCLFYFDLLDAKYADGLFCLKTEDAIHNWWNLIGLPIFNMKPEFKSGELSSKSVAAVISVIVSVKLRLQLFGGCDVPKDPFDFENFMISIGQFQKQIGVDKKRKLDLVTLLRLFHYTNTEEQAKQVYGSFGFDSMLGSFEGSSGAWTSLPGAVLGNRPLPGVSTYRRNRIHYSNELKKFTNVVRNTVQDRIISKEDDEDIFAASIANKSSNKLRSKLASKLTDALTPADVETIEIDVFVKKCLIGQTLMRLWMGLSPSGRTAHSFPKEPDTSQHHGNHLRYNFRGFHGGKEKASEFSFVSFRDNLYASLTLGTDTSRKQSKRRFGFQNKHSQQKFQLEANSFEESLEALPCSEGADCESERLRPRKALVAAEGISSSAVCPDEHQSDSCLVLNRRNSFPYLSSGMEMGLNSLEYIKSEDQLAQLGKKCMSFSNLEGLVGTNSDMYCSERARIDYVNQTAAVLAMEGTMIENTALLSKRLEKQFEQTNYELMRLHNICYHMEQRKNAIEDDYYRMLEGKMKDMTENIDRMLFRTRDLKKKIIELEMNAKKFEFKVKTSAVNKLEAMENSIVNSAKFRQVFKDEEMKRMYFLVTGKDYESPQGPLQEPWRLQALLTYVSGYAMAAVRFLLFDHSRMNLDRIRQTYHKIDPGRKYSDWFYRMVGVRTGLNKVMQDVTVKADSPEKEADTPMNVDELRSEARQGKEDT